MDEEKMRAVIVEAVGAAFQTLEKRLGERLEDLAVDLEALGARFDYFESELREIKHHVAKLSREDIRDRRRIQSLTERVEALERRLAETGKTP